LHTIGAHVDVEAARGCGTTVTGVVPLPARPVGATRRVDLLARREVLEDIPNDSAAALLLIEHHCAVPLRDAIARAGGFRITDGFISPLDLAEIGLGHGRRARAAARHGDGYGRLCQLTSNVEV
jgi:hypothetical protein